MLIQKLRLQYNNVIGMKSTWIGIKEVANVVSPLSMTQRKELQLKNKDLANIDNREVKHDVNGRRQTAKITSDFESFSSKP